ncbi:MAG: hypothetical protein COA82_11830 [Alkaliphilus sp.]|nr:MAG: hypothetical protein COA82_11830 [Alkaliphilus sp.]
MVLLGLYCETDDKTNFEIDLLVEISNGSSTSKKLCSNTINYFNHINTDTQQEFEELFGCGSLIYREDTKTEKMKRRVLKELVTKSNEPYKYRKENGVYDISHEFFQLFRNTEHQEKWIVEILRLLNGERGEKKEYSRIRLFNFARAITHINVFGESKNLYKYKCLENFIKSYFDAVGVEEKFKKSVEDEELNKIVEIEKFTLCELFLYIYKTINRNQKTCFQTI